MPPAYAAAPAGAPAATGGPWYRRRWAVITGAVAAAVILFLGGMAVGTTIDGNDRGDFRGDNGPGMFRDGGGEGFGHDGWGDNGQAAARAWSLPAWARAARATAGTATATTTASPATASRAPRRRRPRPPHPRLSQL